MKPGPLRLIEYSDVARRRTQGFRQRIIIVHQLQAKLSLGRGFTRILRIHLERHGRNQTDLTTEARRALGPWDRPRSGTREMRHFVSRFAGRSQEIPDTLSFQAEKNFRLSSTDSIHVNPRIEFLLG